MLSFKVKLPISLFFAIMKLYFIVEGFYIIKFKTIMITTFTIKRILKLHLEQYSVS